MSTRRRMVLCKPCRPRQAGCCMWTPLDTSLVIIFCLFLGVLIACVIMIVLPYYETNHFIQSTCAISKIEWTGMEYCTNCYTADTGTSRKRRYIDDYLVLDRTIEWKDVSGLDKHRNSRHRRAVCYDDINPPSFPCVKVTVNYTTSENLHSHSGVLHINVEDVYKYPDCSLSSCKESYDENEQAIIAMSNQWQKSYLSGQPITCFYNPYRKDQVLTTAISYLSMLHSLIWPSVVMCGCVMFFILRRFYHCWHLANQVREKPETFDQKPNNLQRPPPQHIIENGRVRSGGAENSAYEPSTVWAIASNHEGASGGLDERTFNAGPSVHLEQVSMIDKVANANAPKATQTKESSDITGVQDIELPNVPETSSMSDDESIPQTGRNTKRATPVLAPPLQFQTGADSSESPYSTPRENTNVRYKVGERKKSSNGEIFSQGQTVSYMNNGIVKYDFGTRDKTLKSTPPSPSVHYNKQTEEVETKLNLPPPMPPKRLSISNENPLDIQKEPRTKANSLPPITGKVEGSEDKDISHGRLSRKQRAEKLREEKRKQRLGSSDSKSSSGSNSQSIKDNKTDLNLDIKDTNEPLTDGDTKILQILKALDPDTPRTPRGQSSEMINSPRGQVISSSKQPNSKVSKADDTLEDPLAKTNIRTTNPDVRPKSILGNRPTSYVEDNASRPERPKSPRAGQRTEHKLSADTSELTSNPLLPRVPSRASMDPVLKSESSKMNSLLKFSRHSDNGSSNLPPDVILGKKPESRQLEPISSRRNSVLLGPPVATGNLKPLRPIAASRPKLNININIPDITDRYIHQQRSLATAKAMDELSEDAMPSARTIIEGSPPTPLDRPRSRSRFHPDNESDEEGAIAINYRPQNMYGDITDSDSLPSDQSHADNDTKYMDDIGNLPSTFYDDKRPQSKGNISNVSEESFSTKYLNRVKEENVTSDLPPLESLNMRILEYVTRGDPNSARSRSVSPESWGGSKASHISYSPNSADALSDGEEPIPNPDNADNIVIKTSDGKSIALPVGAKVIPGEGGLTELNVQNGDETFVLPIPENAQYIVYEYIEEDSTTVSCSTCCNDDQCSRCGGEIPSPIPNRDDVTMEDL